ncbi:MAG: amidohydrolase family protein [Rhodospirillales bacterium]
MYFRRSRAHPSNESRRVSDRAPGAGRGISIIEALKGITTYAAYQASEENKKGTIEPGKLGGLVVLARNPITISRLS